MYNLKLSAEELGTIQYSLISAKSRFLQDPAFFETEIIEIKALLDKLSIVKYTEEEG